MRVSKTLVDGEIASNPLSTGSTASSTRSSSSDPRSQTAVSPVSASAKTSRNDALRQLDARTARRSAQPGARRASSPPYASLLLERRRARSASCPTIAMDPARRSGRQTLTAFYKRNSRATSCPSAASSATRRSTPDALEGAHRRRPRPRSPRPIKQGRATLRRDREAHAPPVVVARPDDRHALAGEVRGGTTLDAAATRARARDRAASTTSTKAALAGADRPAIADAVFAAAQGAVIGPVALAARLAVLHVEKIEQVAAQDARPGQARARHRDRPSRSSPGARASCASQIDDAIANGATFDEVVADAKLDRRAHAAAHARRHRSRRTPDASPTRCSSPRHAQPASRIEQPTTSRSSCRSARTAASRWSSSTRSCPPRRARSPRSATTSSKDFLRRRRRCRRRAGRRRRHARTRSTRACRSPRRWPKPASQLPTRQADST